MKLDEHINKYYHNLNENDLYIWNTIISTKTTYISGST